MSSFFNNIKNRFAKKSVAVKQTMTSTYGEGYIDTGVKIIIGVVVGAIILGGLYALFSGVVIPKLNSKIIDDFNYGTPAQNVGTNAGETQYTMLNAPNSVSDKSDAVFRSVADFSKFRYVTVDGFFVNSNNYTVQSDSNSITMKKSYIASLSDGEHTIRIVFEDGYAESEFMKSGRISFTIEGVGTYEADEGMTWGDWILSYAMSSGSNGIVWVENGTLELYVDIGNGLWVNNIRNQHYGDILIDGMSYRVDGPM